MHIEIGNDNITHTIVTLDNVLNTIIQRLYSVERKFRSECIALDSGACYSCYYQRYRR